LTALEKEMNVAKCGCKYEKGLFTCKEIKTGVSLNFVLGTGKWV